MTAQPDYIPQDLAVDEAGWDLSRQLPVPECRCDFHKYGRRPGADAVLYAGRDLVYLMERAAIRDGRYEDAQEFGTRVTLQVHADFDAAALHVRQTLSRAAEHIAQIRRAA